jgi:hypothetical protein
MTGVTGGIRKIDVNTGGCGDHMTKQWGSYQRLFPAGGAPAVRPPLQE